MIRIPKWWRRFSRQMLFQDLMAGRRVMMTVTEPDGTRHSHLEWVERPIPPLFAPTEAEENA